MTGSDAARELDAADELAGFRAEFDLPPGRIYLDGNSLGPMCRAAGAELDRAVLEWKRIAVGGWLEGDPPWFGLAEQVGEQMGALVGARPGEVVAANGTTVNLHQLLSTLFRPSGRRTKILADTLDFPSDIYALQSHLRLRGFDPAEHLVRVAPRAGFVLEEDDLIAAMRDDVAFVVLPGVVFTTGQLLDMERLAREARARGIPILLDLCHSIGAVPHSLAEWGVDGAYWCTYKYLNNGPGGIGGLYLNSRHSGTVPGLAGWFSSDKGRQFEMGHTLHAAVGAGAMQIGTPDILSLAVLKGALSVVAQAGIERIRRKSLALTGFLMRGIETQLADCGFSFANPSDDWRRGGHVALVHSDAERLCAELNQAGVVVDFRPPSIIRLAPVALYNSFGECEEAVRRLKEIVRRRR